MTTETSFNLRKNEPLSIFALQALRSTSSLERLKKRRNLFYKLKWDQNGTRHSTSPTCG